MANIGEPRRQWEIEDPDEHPSAEPELPISVPEPMKEPEKVPAGQAMSFWIARIM